jgi:hypothetical protein
MSEFIKVETFVKNDWYRYADFGNIGGILGLGYNGTGSAFWNDSGAMAPYFSIELIPKPSDWDWIPGAQIANKTSSMYIGAVDPTILQYA